MNHQAAFAGVDALAWMQAAGDYLTDRCQRSVLFWDVLRRRGNNYLKHLEAGQPPVLIFDYEMVADGRTFPRPVNYSMVRILDRRETVRRISARSRTTDRRVTRLKTAASPEKIRPIVIIDPRAGHGPGIGGFKLNSQIGVALDFGYPVYFVLFYRDPEPGQTFADVHQAEIQFLETVARRHPRAPKPVVIGNCQAGWAAALIGAQRPDVTGPLVFNGSPLSYWGGVKGANPMRYRGALFGGAWLTSLCCDMGNGRFDGAHLVAGFEDLNPANTFWSKPYHLFANVDSEATRFLEFEKWWGGYFKLNAKEIHFIVDSLFIGNELEQGRLRLDDGTQVNLKSFKAPIFVFASGGDNITPPPQALNWIYKVYGSAEEIRRCGQVIVYMVHENVGHLGIFVSGTVAQKEHREIIGSLEMIDYLSPGLYEMVIDGKPSLPWLDDYQVRFVQREMQDILALDDGIENEAAFFQARAVSRFNDYVYRNLARPWVQMMVTEPLAEALRQIHPLRVANYGCSYLNPGCWPLPVLAKAVNAKRHPVTDDNLFVALEKGFSAAVEVGLNLFRDFRDLSQEFWFRAVYDLTFSKNWFAPSDSDPFSALHQSDGSAPDRVSLRQAAIRGGFPEALVRIVIALIRADQMVDRRQFEAAVEIVTAHPRLRRLPPARYQAMIKDQARILENDMKLALAGLPQLLPTRQERLDALGMARRIVQAGLGQEAASSAMLDRLHAALGVAATVNAPKVLDRAGAWQ
jgi:pimeloyl-ACP methyl ester carboxylesterase